MSIASVAKWVLGMLDALALFSIYATTEIRLEAGMGVLAIFLLRTLRVRLRSLGMLVILVLGIVGLGVFVALRFHVYPILVAAHVGVVVHALLWLGKDDVRDRVLRLSMGFINLTLAAALTAELYLFGSIFAFAILGSIYISLGFLESSFKARLPGQVDQPLPKGYLKNMLSVSFAVFLISVLLFPLIPRTSWKKWDSSTYFQLGYNETVDLSSTGQSPASQSGRVALRVLSLSPEISDDPREVIPWDLLRGRTLDLFDGTRWLPRTSQRAQTRKVTPTQLPFSNAQFEVIREPQLSHVVFKPYGAVIAEVGGESGRSHYLFRSAQPGKERELEEAPDEKDLEVPPAIRTPRLADLARAIMGHATSNSEKARLLSTFYKSGFKGTLEATQTSRSVPAVLDNFLFKNKAGSCELFAASAALLLRLQDVPARVIAGYRVSRPTSSGLLTVLDGDAHAWTEYWHESRGWLPLDPTPRVLRLPGWFDSFQQLYWLAEGKWYHWVITFGKDTADPAANEPMLTNASELPWAGWSGRWKRLRLGSFSVTEVGLLLLGGLLFLGLLLSRVLGLIRPGELRPFFRSGVSWERRRLYFEYLRHERSARKLAPLPEHALPASREWWTLYLKLRFGRPEPAAFQKSIQRLTLLTREFRRAIKSG